MDVDSGSDILTPPKLVPSKRPAGTVAKEPDAKLIPQTVLALRGSHSVA